MSYRDNEPWDYEEDPGPLVRPFAITRGRVGKDLHKLDILTMVVAVRTDADMATHDREYSEIMRLCRGRPISLVELAAHLNLLIAAVKVLVSDLIESGHVIFRSPPPPVSGPDPMLLQAVLDGIRKL